MTATTLADGLRCARNPVARVVVERQPGSEILSGDLAPVACAARSANWRRPLTAVGLR
jgi:hypothetical protein